MKIKSIFSVLLAAIMAAALPTFAVGYTSKDLDALTVKAAVSLGTPVTDVQVLGNSLEVRPDGTVMFYGVTSGPPAMLFAYNVDTGEIEDLKPLQVAENVDMAKVCYAADMGPDGILNLATQSNSLYLRYNPKTKELKCYGKVFSETAVMTSGYADAKGNYYFGTYPNAKLIQYNKSQDKLIDLGVMIEGENYVHSLSGYGTKIFMGGVGNPITQFVKYDTATGIKTVLDNPAMPGVFGKDDVGTYHASSTAGKYLFARVKVNSLNANYMCVFDMEQEVWIDFIPGTLHLHATDFEEGKIYYHNGVNGKAGLFSYDPTTKESTRVEGIEFPSSYLVKPAFATLKDQKTYPGRTLIAGSNAEGIVLINLEKKSVTYVKEPLPHQATNIRTIKGGYNGDIIVSAYMGAKVVIYDSYHESIRMEAPSVQIEGINVFDGKYYFGLYGKGRLTEFDPTYVGGSTNPKQIAHMSTYEQDRAFNVVDAGTHILWGSYPDYGRLGGAVGVYRKSTKRYSVYPKPVSNQAIAGLAYQNGLIYGSTSVYGGLGIDPIDDHAKLFTMDLATGTVQKVVDVKLSSNSDKQYFVGDMIFDPKGRLWVACARTLIQVDPQTLGILREIPIGTGRNTLDKTRALPYRLEFGPDGLLYTNIGNRISAVDLDTFETKTLLEQSTIGIAISTNGNLYYIGSNVNYLYKLELERSEPQAPPSPVTSPYVFTSNEALTVNGRVIPGPKGITFATVYETADYELLEYGMVFSLKNNRPELNQEGDIKVKAEVEKSSLGRFGILFSNVKFNQIYYARPYSIYKRNNEEFILYGEPLNFTGKEN